MPSSNPNQGRTNRPVCFNFEIPCEDCIQPVSFVDIPRFYIIGESITVNYTILKTFNPKSEDWIGLFKCCHNIDKCFEFVGFRWAQKKPTFKYRPLSRTVVFYPEDLDIRPSEDKYIFLYLTSNERIIGQSSLFDFKLFSSSPQEFLEILISSPQEEDKMEEIENNTATEEEKHETIANLEEKVGKTSAAPISINRPELPKPWYKNREFYKMSKPKYVIVEEQEQTKSDVIESDVKDTHEDEKTKGVYSIKEESIAEIENESLSKSQSKVHHVPNMIQIFEKLINQETSLVNRVNDIEKKNEEFIMTQKTIQEQILQYMKNIEQLAKPEKPVSFKSQQTQYNKPRRRLPKIIQDAINQPKNLRYYFPKENAKETFSGSEMTFKYLFNEIKQEKLKMVASEEEIEESEKQSESKKTTEVRKAATDISNLLKKLINHVEDNSSKKVGASVSLQNNIQKEDRTINFDDFNQLLKKKRSLQVSVQPKNGSTYSGSNIAIDLLFNQESDPVTHDKTETEDQSTNDNDRKNCSLKVTLSNEQDLNQSILQMTLNDFFVGICDNEPVFLDICKTDDLRKRKRGQSLRTMNMEFDETKTDSNLETILTTTSDVVEQFRSRSLREKLLTSSSYPSGNRYNPVACQRLQQLKEKMFSNKDSSKATFEDEKISNASMAVQIGSAEETSAVLSSTPAVTRLTLLDSYEILASSRQDEFDYNRSIKQDHTAKLLLIRNILQSDITDEEKILNIEQLTLSSPTKASRPKKQFQYRQWNKKNKKTPERNAKTEHETSDTSAESYKTNETTGSYPDPLTNNEFRGRKKSKKLKKNKFGRNKFTQTNDATTAKAESQTSESSLDDNSKFPKLVRKPLPSSIIPVLLSDSKNSIHASSEEDFKAKPILKKKASPLPQLTKECGQNARKTSVTFLVDASIQCETADFNKIYEDADTSNIKTLIDKHLVDLKSNQSDTTNQDDEPQGHKRERKVSFNTIILTSLFDNEENEKDDQKGTIRTIRPNGKSTWPIKEHVDTNANKIPPVHQFLDFIEKEVKNVSENTAVLQNSLNKAMRIFKAEAVMLKDRSADVLTKAIRAISPHRIPLQRKPSPANIEIKLTSVAPIAETKNRISRSRSNEPRVTATSSPKEMHKPVSENLVEIEKRKKPKLQVDEKSDLIKNQIKSDKDLEYLQKEIELQMFLQNFLRQVKTLTDKDSAEKEPPEDGKQSEKTPTESLSPTFKKSAEEAKVSDDDAHQVRRTISDSLKVPQHYWSYDAVKKKDIPKNESNASLINNPETPVVSLYSQSDCYKSSYTVGTQSLINSYCPPSNRSERQRISGMMLLQSFDSTISNIVKLYNNFTNYAYSSLINPNFSIQSQKDNTVFPRIDDEENGTFLNPELTSPYTCPNPSRSDSNESEECRQPEVSYERRPSYDYEEIETKISLPMSFSNSEEDAKHDKISKNEKNEIDIIKSLFKSEEEKTNEDPILETSVQDKSEKINEENRETDIEILPHHPTIIVDEKERNDKIIEEMSKDLNDIKNDAKTSVEFCLTCSDEFPSLKSIIEADQKQEKLNSTTVERSKKKKKD